MDRKAEPPSRGSILLAERDTKTRCELAGVLRSAGFTVADVSDADQILRLLSQQDFDAALLATDLGESSGMALLRDLSAFGMVTPVMMTAPVADLDLAIEAMRLGAVDLLICPIALVDAIERVSEAVKKGRRSRLLQEARLRVLELAETAEALEAEFVSNPASGLRPRSAPLNEDPLSALEPSLLSRLTPRERDVTRRLAQGLSVSQMARELELSPNTVRNHVKSIFNKLQVRSQVALLSLLIGARSGSVKSPV